LLFCFLSALHKRNINIESIYKDIDIYKYAGMEWIYLQAGEVELERADADFEEVVQYCTLIF